MFTLNDYNLIKPNIKIENTWDLYLPSQSDKTISNESKNSCFSCELSSSICLDFTDLQDIFRHKFKSISFLSNNLKKYFFFLF